jgi:hypothetical protein
VEASKVGRSLPVAFCEAHHLSWAACSPYEAGNVALRYRGEMTG